MDRKGIHPAFIFVILTALLGAVAAGIYFWRRPTPAPSDLIAPERAAEPSPVNSPPPQELLPALDESDSLVRSVVGTLSSHPRLLTWIASDADLVRAFVTSIDRVAAGESPRNQLATWAPEGAFEAMAGEGGSLVAAPQSTGRYDFLIEVLSAVDTESAALAYQRLRPLFFEAYLEVGKRDTSFDSVLAGAIAELMAVPTVQSPMLEATVEGYRYQDPALESLSAAQKHLLRMGAANMRRVQEKLRSFAEAVSLQQD